MAWEIRRLRDPATGRIPNGIRSRELAYAATLPKHFGGSAFYKSAGVEAYGWEARGPYNVGGRTRALALDVTGEDTILAGGVSGGLWRSTDGGGTWNRRTLPTQFPGVTCIAQDTRSGKTSTWYYGTGELYGNSASDPYAFYFGDGIYKSTDNGLTWDRLASTGSTTPTVFDDLSDFTWSIAIDPSNSTSDELYAAHYGVIRRSTNGGKTWGTVFGASPYSYVTDVAVTGTGVVYVTMSGDGTRKGIWRSTTGNVNSFVPIAPPDWPAEYRRIEIGLAPSNDSVVYFLAETPGFGSLGRNFRGDSSWQSLWKYTYLSGNGSGDGGRWEDLSANLPKFGGSNGDLFSQTGYDLHVSVKPDDENVVFVGGTSLYRSTDGFRTPDHVAWVGGFRDWKRDSAVIEGYSYPNHHADQHSLIFSRTDPTVAYSSSDGGVHKTLDCLADSIVWASLDRGYNTTQFYDVAIDHGTSGNDMVIGGMQDNGTWGVLRAGTTEPWREYGTSDGGFCAVRDGGREIYVSKQQGKVFRVLLNTEGEMTDFTRVDPSDATGYLFISPFILDPSDNRIMYSSGGNYLYRNSDLTAIPLNGTASTSVGWTKFGKSFLSDTTLISAVAASTANPAHRIYYGTSDGQLFRMDDANAGEPDPITATGAAFPQGGYITWVAVDPEDGDRVVVVFSNYGVESLFLSEDAGETWTPIGGNLEPADGVGPSCRTFSFLHRANGTICFVGTSAGLYSTNKLDGASTVWAQEGPESIGAVVVDAIDVRQSDGYVVVGTHGNGVYSTTVTTLGTEEGSDRVTGSGLLRGNHPNPARDETTIDFTVPDGVGAGPARLSLYDMKGAEVRVIVDERLTAGSYSRRVDLRAIPAGTYLCLLRVGDRIDRRNIVVVR